MYNYATDATLWVKSLRLRIEKQHTHQKKKKKIKPSQKPIKKIKEWRLPLI